MHLQKKYKRIFFIFTFTLFHNTFFFSILFERQLVTCLNVVYFEIFLMTELFKACSKFHFKKDSCYSVNHLTGFCLVLPFIGKKMFEQSLIRYIRLNSLHFLNLIRRQFYFTNYQDSFKSSFCQVFLIIDVLTIDVAAKKEKQEITTKEFTFQ